jgi:hypothetical protein
MPIGINGDVPPYEPRLPSVKSYRNAVHWACALDVSPLMYSQSHVAGYGMQTPVQASENSFIVELNPGAFLKSWRTV